MCNSLLWFSFLTATWAFGTTIFTTGLLYLALPYDLVPARLSRIGYVDNMFALVAVGLGFHSMVQAHRLEPMPDILRTFWEKATSYNELNFCNAILALSILTIVFSSSVRYTVIGFEVILGIPLLAFNFLQAPYALAISLFMFGFFRDALKPVLEIFNIDGVFPFMSHGCLAGLALWGYAFFMQIPYESQ
jgi:uncharacterized membrane protein YkvA (DUF1232 family)